MHTNNTVSSLMIIYPVMKAQSALIQQLPPDPTGSFEPLETYAEFKITSGSVSKSTGLVLDFHLTVVSSVSFNLLDEAPFFYFIPGLVFLSLVLTIL